MRFPASNVCSVQSYVPLVLRRAGGDPMMLFVASLMDSNDALGLMSDSINGYKVVCVDLIAYPSRDGSHFRLVAMHP